MDEVDSSLPQKTTILQQQSAENIENAPGHYPRTVDQRSRILYVQNELIHLLSRYEDAVQYIMPDFNGMSITVGVLKSCPALTNINAIVAPFSGIVQVQQVSPVTGENFLSKAGNGSPVFQCDSEADLNRYLLCQSDSNAIEAGTIAIVAKDDDGHAYIITAMHLFTKQHGTHKLKGRFWTFSTDTGKILLSESCYGSLGPTEFECEGSGSKHVFIDIAALPLSEDAATQLNVSFIGNFSKPIHINVLSEDVLSGHNNSVQIYHKQFGVRKGTVYCPAASYKAGGKLCHDHILVKSSDPQCPFADKGHSGSAVTDELHDGVRNAQTFGLLWQHQLLPGATGASSTNSESNKIYFVMRWDYGLKSLKKEFGLKLSFDELPDNLFGQ